MAVGVVVAQKSEFDAIFKDISVLTVVNPNCRKLGISSINEVYVYICGEGKVNAALGTEKLIQIMTSRDEHIDKIVNLGVVGSLNSELEPYEIVTPTKIYQTDSDYTSLGLKSYQGYTSQGSIIDAIFVDDSNSSKKVVLGTSDTFVSDDSLKDSLRSNGIDIVDMEAYSIGYTCSLHNVEFIAHKCIYDSCDADEYQEYDMSRAGKELLAAFYSDIDEMYVDRVPNFPKQGVTYLDINKMLRSGKLSEIVDRLSNEFNPHSYDYIATIESRGYLLAAPMAYINNKKLICIRKEGKLPGNVISTQYSTEYSNKGTIELQMNAFESTRASRIPRVLLIDDILATGNSAKAAIRLIENLGGTIVGVGYFAGIKGLCEPSDFTNLHVLEWY